MSSVRSALEEVRAQALAGLQLAFPADPQNVARPNPKALVGAQRLRAAFAQYQALHQGTISRLPRSNSTPRII